MTDTTDPQAAAPSAPADLPARLEAVLTERFTELGNPYSEMRRHEQGPDGWPASHPVGAHHVAEVLKALLAAAGLPAGGAPSCGCLNEDAVEYQFGSKDCTCIPFTRKGGKARYCQPGDTVNDISGWERGGDCPHHKAAEERPS